MASGAARRANIWLFPRCTFDISYFDFYVRLLLYLAVHIKGFSLSNDITLKGVVC